MTLAQLLQNIEVTLVKGSLDKTVVAIEFDSRKIIENSVFIAIQGTQTDGHQYINAAIQNGCHTVICETLPQETDDNITWLLSTNAAKTLALLASNFYGNPSHKIKVVGITGTNGKTTTVTLLHTLFRRLGYQVGLLSTVQNQINEQIIPTQYTTPDAVQLQTLLAEMVKQGCQYCFMEVSSHALIQERVTGVKFAGAVFSNITHDHLDYHGTFQNYIYAKKKFFDELNKDAFALVNMDDKRGMVMLQNCKAKTQKTFALRSPSDFKARLIENTLEGLLLEINQQEIWFRLIGDFNAYNLLGIYAIAILLGEDEQTVLTELSGIPSASGRFEQIASPRGVTAIVDYAHTPDALKNVLQTIQQIRTQDQNIITVVGCGGDRDKTKRPIMAKIAFEYSDKIIFTSDNPRSEDPMQILEDMLEGLSITEKPKAMVIENRFEAIQEACRIALPSDIILVAGKGHETYQEIKGVRYDFDDREVLKQFL